MPGRNPVFPAPRDIRRQTYYPGVSLSLAEMVALGHIAGAKIVHFTGRREDVDGEAEAWSALLPTTRAPYRPDISGGPIGWTPEPLTAQSTSSDDGGAGSGAQVLLVEYLNADGFERIGLALLAGTGTVPVLEATSQGVGNANTIVPLMPPTPATGVRVNRVTVVAGGVPAGNCTVDLGGQAAQRLLPGQALSSTSRFTVPRGFIGLIHGLGYGVDREQRGLVRVYAQPLGRLDYEFTAYEASNGALAVPLAEPIRLAPLGELGLTFEKDSGGGNIDVSSILQPIFLPDPNDPDPAPERQAPPLG